MCSSTTGRCCAAWNISKSLLEGKVHTRTNKTWKYFYLLPKEAEKPESLQQKHPCKQGHKQSIFDGTHFKSTPQLFLFFAAQVSELIDLYDKGGTKDSYLKDVVL